MSTEAVQSVIGRAVMDGQFRNNLFADPDAALANYDLTEQEMAVLKAIDSETMESFAGVLDDRISKSLAIGVTPEDAAPGLAESETILRNLPEGA